MCFNAFALVKKERKYIELMHGMDSKSRQVITEEEKASLSLSLSLSLFLSFFLQLSCLSLCAKETKGPASE